jgi:hypothetical protein
MLLAAASAPSSHTASPASVSDLRSVAE